MFFFRDVLKNTKRKKSVLGFIYFLIGTFILWRAFKTPPEVMSTFRFFTLGAISFGSLPAFLACGTISLLCGILSVLPADGKARWNVILFWITAASVVAAILVWAGMGRRIDLIGLATQSLRLATPIAIGAFAGILSERSGIVNIGIEGMMLAAACTGFTAALYAQNIWIGLMAAMAGGALMAALHALLSIRFLVDQIVSGVAVNILAVGITGFMNRAFLRGSLLEAPPVFPVWHIPVLSEIPIAGKILFSHQPMVYAMLVFTVVLHVALFHTRWGLRTRTVGEHPKAADTLGVDVYGLRYANVVAGGIVAGFGGAWFSLETVGSFDDLMTGGKGFIALAAMIFGKWNPAGALCGALLFGFADALQIKLQIVGVNVPYQFLGMAPYAVTMIVLAGVVGKAVAPAADGIPYDRDGA